MRVALLRLRGGGGEKRKTSFLLKKTKNPPKFPRLAAVDGGKHRPLMDGRSPRTTLGVIPEKSLMSSTGFCTFVHVKQTKFFKTEKSEYGGDLQKKRRGRGARPISTKESMHFVLRSTKAKGAWSFTRHRKKIEAISNKFAKKYGIKIYGIGNAGNHLHYQIRIGNRYTYRAFIRALTSAIAMAVSKNSRWNRIGKFWDRRPFSRIVFSWTAFKRLQSYLLINEAEGRGHGRDIARAILGEFSTA